MATKEEVRTVADKLLEIGVKPPKKPLKEFGYPNLALCVVDTTFAQRGRLGTASGPVASLRAFGASKGWVPSVTARKLTLSEFVGRLGKMTDKQLTGTVFADARTTTSIKDLPVARVAVELSRNLAAQGIETKADLLDAEKGAGLAAAVKSTRGIGPAGAAYLVSLASTAPGETAPWLVEFVAGALERPVEPAEAREIVDLATKRLRKKVKGLAIIDVEQRIWRSMAGFVKAPTGA